ncbi:MAG: hypothetical protein ACR2QC_11710 [Gammaproteobacteria bacterium]
MLHNAKFIKSAPKKQRTAPKFPRSPPSHSRPLCPIPAKAGISAAAKRRVIVPLYNLRLRRGNSCFRRNGTKGAGMGRVGAGMELSGKAEISGRFFVFRRGFDKFRVMQNFAQVGTNVAETPPPSASSAAGTLAERWGRRITYIRL